MLAGCPDLGCVPRFPTSDTHWYWGETCALRTSKSLVYGSVGAVGALLVVMVVVLIILLGRSQRKLHR